MQIVIFLLLLRKHTHRQTDLAEQESNHHKLVSTEWDGIASKKKKTNEPKVMRKKRIAKKRYLK